MTLAQLRRLPPLDRIREAAALMDEHRDKVAELARIRADAVAELRAEGMSVADIARELGVTVGAVYKLGT